MYTLAHIKSIGHSEKSKCLIKIHDSLLVKIYKTYFTTINIRTYVLL